MREIKFRAFVKHLGQLADVLSIDFLESEVEIYLVDRDEIRIYPFSEDEIVLLPFTGLKDYAGDDIYEGDIVEVVISNKPKRFEVLWDEGGAMFLFAPLFKTKPMGAIDFYELEDEYGKVIVIGNKFENPELLEGTV